MLFRLHRTLGWLALGIVILTVAAYAHYAHIDKGYATGTYRMLGRAFLAGHTYLDVGNFPWVRDFSRYNGKFYLYYGPLPALLWAFFKLVGLDLGDMQLAFIFACLGSAALTWLLANIVQKKAMPLWVLPLTALTLNFGTWLPLMLGHRSPMPYAVCIAGAYCFIAWGVCALWYAADWQPHERMHAVYKILASLCFGLAAASRAFFMLEVVVLGLIWISGIKKRNLHAVLYDGVLLAGPWSLCIAALAAYNYYRFGTPWETGYIYQVGVDRFATYYHVHSVEWHFDMWPRHAWSYFLQPIPLGKLLPWRHEFGTITMLGNALPFQYAYGLWICSPFSLWGLWFIGHIRQSRDWLGDQYETAVTFIIIALVPLTVLLGYIWFTSRYMVDFSPWFMLCAVIGFMDALSRTEGRTRTVVISLGVISAVISTYIGAANPFCGFYACGG